MCISKIQYFLIVPSLTILFCALAKCTCNTEKHMVETCQICVPILSKDKNCVIRVSHFLLHFPCLCLQLLCISMETVALPTEITKKKLSDIIAPFRKLFFMVAYPVELR